MDQTFFTDMQKVTSRLKQTESKEYQESWIQKCVIEHFPPVVFAQIEKLLNIKSKNDVSRVLVTLYQLRDEGVSAVWDKIKPAVIVNARRMCGTIFPDECIEAGKSLPIDMTYFNLFTADQIIKIDINHEMMDAVRLAAEATTHNHDAELNEYVANHPIMEIDHIIDEAFEPSVSDKLLKLADLVGDMGRSMESLLNLFSDGPPLNLFPPVKKKSGCEPPPGSVIDSEGRTTAPRL